jgi:hypothetical protein
MVKECRGLPQVISSRSKYDVIFRAISFLTIAKYQGRACLYTLKV